MYFKLSCTIERYLNFLKQIVCDFYVNVFFSIFTKRSQSKCQQEKVWAWNFMKSLQILI